ncbi:MAG: HAD-IA family hydrolase [Patescibacteria group bacterium]|nr:HAD-IA family hydrolase [Patescibacteria group bacterium]
MLARLDLPAIKQPKFSLSPDFIATSVAAINFSLLKSHGIKACFIDLDGTVVSRATHEVQPAIVTALKQAGLPIFIATNRPRSRGLKNLKQDLSAAGVIHPTKIFAKPAKRYYTSALAAHNFKAHEVIMIGDRYIQDIFGANRAGLYSLVVHKNGASHGQIDRLLSKVEAKLTQLFTGRYRQTD